MARKNSSAAPPLPPLPSSLVAFVDVLGFTDRVLSIRTQAELDALDKDIERVQHHFAVDTDDEVTLESHEISKKEILAFSDCIVLSTSLHSDLAESQGTFDTLMSEIGSLAISQVSCIDEGIFLRGAVELGPWHRTNNRLISPAMARAYYLERRAVVPVIRLSEDVTKFFQWHTHRYFYSDDYDPVPSSFLIYKDALAGDSFWFIDYMNLCINNIDWCDSRARREEYLATPPEERGKVMDAGYENNVRRFLAAHRDRIVAGYKKAKVPGVKLKYRWLANYHNMIVKQYQGSLAATRVLGKDVPPPSQRYRIEKLPRRPKPDRERLLDIRREQDKLAGAT
jgi:hypothetical protein